MSPSRIARGQDPITEADIAQVAPQLRAAVRAQLGKPICGLSRSLRLTGVADEFRPSAAFVAQQAAALVVGGLIRSSDAGESTLRHDVEYDAMFGPYTGMTTHRVPNPTCRCQEDAELIAQVRHSRRPMDTEFRHR